MLKQYEYVFILVGLLIACGTMLAAGYRIGSGKVQMQFDSYKQKQEIAAQQQEIAAKQKEIENAKRTAEITTSYEADIRRLNAALRMRNTATGASAMSAAASGAPRIDATGAAASGTCEGTEFYKRALATELQLETWQSWATKQNFPVQ